MNEQKSFDDYFFIFNVMVNLSDMNKINLFKYLNLRRLVACLGLTLRKSIRLSKTIVLKT